jgi:CBS domain-containing protein
MDGRMLPFERSRAAAAARLVLDRGGWCLLELCVDVPRQRWEPRVLICERDPEAVAVAIESEIARQPQLDARVTGCDRRTLKPDPALGSQLCYVAATPGRPRRTRTRRTAMLVREGMNPIVVTVGPEHTLREAARRMTARGVGAAVVVDNEQPGPGIITERDLLHASGVGQDVDAELVRDHLTSELVYAAADWSLEQAAAEMTRGGFRHIVVLDGSELVGILSMRDIVRCWTSDGASCELTG